MTLPRRQFLLLTASAVAAPAVLHVAQAQDYPSRPIRLLVGYPPGGATDIIARICAQGLSERLGKPVVVENRPGTGGNLAGEAAARAAPDGYTLLHGADNMFTINPHVYAKMPYDPLKELTPIASLASYSRYILRCRRRTCVNSWSLLDTTSRHCSMLRSAMAACTISRWRCSSSM